MKRSLEVLMPALHVHTATLQSAQEDAETKKKRLLMEAQSMLESGVLNPCTASTGR